MRFDNSSHFRLSVNGRALSKKPTNQQSFTDEAEALTVTLAVAVTVAVAVAVAMAVAVAVAVAVDMALSFHIF